MRVKLGTPDGTSGVCSAVYRSAAQLSGAAKTGCLLSGWKSPGLCAAVVGAGGARRAVPAAAGELLTNADKTHPYLLCVAGLMLHLDNLKIYNPAALAKGAEYSGNVLVAPGATVGKGCLIGPDVSIGDGCVIGDGVRLSNCVVMRGVRIKDHSKVGACKCCCCWLDMSCGWGGCLNTGLGPGTTCPQ